VKGLSVRRWLFFCGEKESRQKGVVSVNVLGFGGG